MKTFIKTFVLLLTLPLLFFSSSPIFAIQEDPLTAGFLQSLNPATNFTLGNNFLSSLISGLLPYAIVFGGILLLIMLIMGGFAMLTSPTNPQAQEKGKNQITFAIAGFVLIFSAYWIIQILELVFQVNITGTTYSTSTGSSSGGGSSSNSESSSNGLTGGNNSSGNTSGNTQTNTPENIIPGTPSENNHGETTYTCPDGTVCTFPYVTCDGPNTNGSYTCSAGGIPQYTCPPGYTNPSPNSPYCENNEDADSCICADGSLHCDSLARKCCNGVTIKGPILNNFICVFD
jgi:hypothetical protein